MFSVKSIVLAHPHYFWTVFSAFSEMINVKYTCQIPYISNSPVGHGQTKRFWECDRSRRGPHLAPHGEGPINNAVNTAFSAPLPGNRPFFTNITV